MRVLRGGWLVMAALSLFSLPAMAWWNSEWGDRRAVDVDWASTGIAGPVGKVLVPIRLHSGNFRFDDASEDGSDLRLVADDDRTPLPYFIEQYDRENELAVIWVRLAVVTTDTPQRVWIYFGNPDVESGSDPVALHAGSTLVALHFDAAEALPADVSGLDNHPVRSTVVTTHGGAIAAGALFAENSAIVLSRSPSLEVPEAGHLTFSAWLRPSSRGSGLILSHQDGESSLQFGTDQGRLYSRVATGDGGVVETERTDPLEPDRWYHVALTADGESLNVYVDGVERVRVAASLPRLAGSVVLGADGELPAVAGDMDQVEIANIARPPVELRLSALLQTPDGAPLSFAASAEGSGRAYLDLARVIAMSVSPEGWVIVGIILILGVISAEVLVRKQLLLHRIERADQAFLRSFQGNALDAFANHGMGEQADNGLPADEQSSLLALHRVTLDEVNRIDATLHDRGQAFRVTPEVSEVLRATIDAEIVRQAARLNREMVVPTLAISGAPFLGLLGTVIGVMITFGAITLVGDVNVATIAPGVAAALVTTVAGLLVAIPVMFGYNRLTTVIRDLTIGMETFANKLLARIAMATMT
jgi:biopolymer transport protein ExbB